LPPDQSAKKVKVPANSQVKHILCNSAADYGAGEAWISSLDNCLRRVSLTLGTFVGEAIDIKENATGIGWFDEHETKLLVGSSKGTMHCVSDKGIEWSRAGLVKRSPTAFASAKGMKAAFGIDKPDTMVNGIPSEEYNIHLFGIAGVSAADGVMEEAVLQGHKAEVTCLKFSPTGEFLASGDSSKVIKIWCLMDGGKGAGKGGGYSPGEAPVLTAEMELEYNAHAARVTTLAWMPSGQLLSGSLDQNITVWDIDYATKKVKVKAELKGASFKETSCSAAHRGGVGAVVACGDKQFASVGDDGFLLVHEFA
jgi:WD40 repeat protein